MAASQFDATEELRGFVDLNFARRLEMAEILTPTHVRALERFWPEATSEVIAGGVLRSLAGKLIPRITSSAWVSTAR